MNTITLTYQDVMKHRGACFVAIFTSSTRSFSVKVARTGPVTWQLFAHLAQSLKPNS